MARENPDKLEKLLTGIPYAYTLATNSDENDMESIVIRQFLDSLADVALSVASRNTTGEGERIDWLR